LENSNVNKLIELVANEHKHFHPSGNPSPSSEDTNITKAIKAAGDILKIKLLDHVIVGSYCNYYSFKENGLI
jgi:DNA repair protein RadC